MWKSVETKKNYTDNRKRKQMMENYIKKKMKVGIKTDSNS